MSNLQDSKQDIVDDSSAVTGRPGGPKKQVSISGDSMELLNDESESKQQELEEIDEAKL